MIQRRRPALPHDATGPSWHHTIEALAAIVEFGKAPPKVLPCCVFDMPTFARTLSRPAG